MLKFVSIVHRGKTTLFVGKHNGKPKQREIKDSSYEVLQYWNLVSNSTNVKVEGRRGLILEENPCAESVRQGRKTKTVYMRLNEKKDEKKKQGKERQRRRE